MKKYKVVVAHTAQNDLSAIKQYITDAYNDSYNANIVVSRILDKIDTLASFPKVSMIRHSNMGKALRYARSQKYTIVYNVDDRNATVYVQAVINSRRDILSILEKRTSDPEQ